MGIISIIATQRTREFIFEVIVLSFSWLVIIVSLVGVLVSLILVSPSGMVLLGVIST